MCSHHPFTPRLKSLFLAMAAVTFTVGTGEGWQGQPQPVGYTPGARVLLDAHNAYPERGRWRDRIDRALATGVPVAIEQDLHWGTVDGRAASVVGHDSDALSGAPALRDHFFERIRPIMERALRENRREQWPLVVLNLDFKDNKPAHLEYIVSLLHEYRAWLTTAARPEQDSTVDTLTVGPLLVLGGSAREQRARFFDALPPGTPMRIFGAMLPAPVAGSSRAERNRRAIAMTADEHIPRRADAYARWVNFPWSVVEQDGQNAAGPWDGADDARLRALVERAHAQGYWIRFYTLDGFSRRENQGFTDSYNFGSRERAALRWKASIDAGVDFIATDQYGALAELLRPRTR